MMPGTVTVTTIPIATASIAWGDTVTAPAARRDPEVAAQDMTIAGAGRCNGGFGCGDFGRSGRGGPAG